MKMKSFQEPAFKEEMVRALSDSVQSTLQEIKKLNGWGTFNSKYFASWDIRFTRISDLDGINNAAVIFGNRRIWDFVMLICEETGTLFVFTKEANLKTVQKNFGKEKIHYFHSFLIINQKFDGIYDLVYEPYQIPLFVEGIEDYNEKRKLEALQILGDNFDKVNQVIFVTLKEEKGKATKVEASLFSSEFQLIYREDWSAFIKPSFDESELDDRDSQKDSDNKQKSIPALKPEFQDKIKKKKMVPKRKDTGRQEEDDI